MPRIGRRSPFPEGETASETAVVGAAKLEDEGLGERSQLDPPIHHSPSTVAIRRAMTVPTRIARSETEAGASKSRSRLSTLIPWIRGRAGSLAGGSTRTDRSTMLRLCFPGPVSSPEQWRRFRRVLSVRNNPDWHPTHLRTLVPPTYQQTTIGPKRVSNSESH